MTSFANVFEPSILRRVRARPEDRDARRAAARRRRPRRAAPPVRSRRGRPRVSSRARAARRRRRLAPDGSAERRDPGVAGRRVELGERRALRELPGERVLARTRADEKHLHAGESTRGGSTAKLPAAPSCSCWTLPRRARLALQRLPARLISRSPAGRAPRPTSSSAASSTAQFRALRRHCRSASRSPLSGCSRSRVALPGIPPLLLLAAMLHPRQLRRWHVDRPLASDALSARVTSPPARPLV